MNGKELYDYCKAQEDKYIFPEFSRNDVWELGCTLVEEYSKASGPLAATIWLNDTELFRYYPEGTGEFHHQWLERKRKTVKIMNMSSMRWKAKLEMNGSSMAAECLDPIEYADCGGGFPIRIKGGAVIGFIGASGLSDDEDHAAIIAGLETFFRKKGYLK